MNKKHLVLKITLFLFCIGPLLFSLNNYIKDHYQKQIQEKIHLNWNKNLITQIQIIKNDEDCLEQYQPVKFAQIFDQNSTDIYKQKYQKDPIQLFSEQVAKTQQDEVNKELSSFAFNNKAQNKQQFWKMCTKSMTDISFSNKKNQLLELCETDEKICPAEYNKIICVSNKLSCPSNSDNYCSSDKKQCIVNSMISCVDKEESCPENDKKKQCLPFQKLCIVQDRVLCQDANEQCPIVDILILEKTSQTPENYKEEVITFDSDYKLLVKRNDPSKWPIAEIAIFREDKQCLTQSNEIQNLFTIKNDSFQLNTCIDGIDNRYQEIFQESVSTKQLFLSNKIIKDNEEVNLEFNQQFKMYQRQYYFFDTTCTYSNDFENFNTKYIGIIGIIDIIFKSLIAMFLLINIIMNVITNKVTDYDIKKQVQFQIESSYLISIIVSIINVLLLFFLDSMQIKFFENFTSMLIEDECVNQYTKLNILNIQKQLNQLKSFWRILFIIQIIQVVILLINLTFEIKLSNVNRQENNMPKLSSMSFFFLISCFFCEGFLLICNSCCFCIQSKSRCSCQTCSDRIDYCIKKTCCDYCDTGMEVCSNKCSCKDCCIGCKECFVNMFEQCSDLIKNCPQDCANFCLSFCDSKN